MHFGNYMPLPKMSPLLKASLKSLLSNPQILDNWTEQALLPVAAKDLAQMYQVTKISDQAAYVWMTNEEYEKERTLSCIDGKITRTTSSCQGWIRDF